jgi:hypothetical protein
MDSSILNNNKFALEKSDIYEVQVATLLPPDCHLFWLFSVICDAV